MNEVPLIVLAAVFLDLLLGDPRWLPHPVVFIGRTITALEKVLRQIFSSERFGGILLLVLTVGVTWASAWLVLKAAYRGHPYAGIAVAVYLSWTCLAARSLHRESRLVAEALEKEDVEGARHWLSRIVGRDTAKLDQPEIWRALVETVSENTSDGVIAPLFYLMIGGPPLSLAYKAVNTLDSMVGYKNERYIRFGWASARFDDVVNFIPARITGLMMILAAPFFGLSGPNALQIMLRDGRNHTSPNSGVPEAAAAGALGVRLGGRSWYFGKPVVKPTIGDPLNPLSAAAYRGAVRLMYGAEALMICWWLLLKGHVFPLSP